VAGGRMINYQKCRKQIPKLAGKSQRKQREDTKFYSKILKGVK
jgi:hypothetical protein